MENTGWEEIVDLARTLDYPARNVRAEDQLRLAMLVLDFNKNVIRQSGIRRAAERTERTSEVTLKHGVASAAVAEDLGEAVDAA